MTAKHGLPRLRGLAALYDKQVHVTHRPVDVAALRAVGGFGGELGRYGGVLLSDEEVRLAWALRRMKRSPGSTKTGCSRTSCTRAV